jgi:hypothetical protein
LQCPAGVARPLREFGWIELPIPQLLGQLRPDGIAEQALRGRQIVALIKRMLVKSLGGTAPSDMDWVFESERIVTLIVGIATQSLFDPRNWTAEKQRRHLAKELRDIVR